jgi:predicted ester cyclase
MKLFKYIVVASVACLVIACTSVDPQITDNKVIAEKFVTTINQKNLDGLDEIMSVDLVRHCQATHEIQVRSLEDFKVFLEETFSSFPDARQEINMMVAEGDKVAMHATLIGTQEGPIGLFPASKREISSDFMGILRIEEGKIAEIWVEWDNLAILSQLGHFPPPEANQPITE